MNHQSKSNKNDLPIGISKPALRALEAAGISKLEDFTSVSEEELLKLHGMGPKAIRIISEALHSQGLDFSKRENSDPFSEKANSKIARRK